MAVPIGNKLRCDDTPWSLSLTTLMQRMPTKAGSECIGILAEENYDDLVHPKNGSADDLNRAFRSITDTNKQAVQNSKHKVIVVAAPFRSSGTYGRTMLRNRIEGIALAHRRLNYEDRRPLRLVLATMGSDIRSSARVAEIVANQARREKRWAALLQLGEPWSRVAWGTGESQANTLEVFARSGDRFLDPYHDDYPTTPAISASTPSEEIPFFLDTSAEGRIKPIYLLDAKTEFDQPGSEKVPATLGGGHRACTSKAEDVYAQATDPKLHRAFLEGVADTCGSSDRHLLMVGQAAAREMVDENVPGLTMPILTGTTTSSLSWKNCQKLYKIMHYSDGIGFSDPCSDHWGDGLLSYDVLRFGAEVIFNIRDQRTA